jgi:hypothetical protein
MIGEQRKKILGIRTNQGWKIIWEGAKVRKAPEARVTPAFPLSLFLFSVRRWQGIPFARCHASSHLLHL